MAERKFTFHNHDLDEGLYTVPCNQCANIKDDDDFEEFKEDIELSLNQYPSLCQHPLDFYNNGKAEPDCYFCINSYGGIFQHCWLCKITVCRFCLKTPPPLTIDFPKGHKHKLTLLARDVSFTCNACGMEGSRNPYVCFECSCMVHKYCIYLPRVININRHDHRVSRVSYLPHGIWKCGVCRQNINCAYGAFTCARCPSYAVHPKCATRGDVWDWKELEDEPEEEEEIQDPFKVIIETDIIHFSHEEHILRLGGSGNANNMRCDGCLVPINNDPFYKCVECEFCLHKTCANLPRKKRHFLHEHKLTLLVHNKGDDWFNCYACKKLSSGFRYGCRVTQKNQCLYAIYDMRCSSISEPFHHALHPHPLYRISTETMKCRSCNRDSDHVLSCIVCDYVLGMECATLPRKVKHRCDDHFLSLCQGVGNASGDLWCDICETKTEPSVWYYTCDLCGVALHVNCVLGDLYYLKQGCVNSSFTIHLNNGASRPMCFSCKSHCRFPFFMTLYNDESVELYACSLECCRPLCE